MHARTIVLDDWSVHNENSYFVNFPITNYGCAAPPIVTLPKRSLLQRSRIVKDYNGGLSRRPELTKKRCSPMQDKPAVKCCGETQIVL